MKGENMIIRDVAKPVLSAAAFDFLGLGRDEAIKEVAKQALDKYGCGSCGPRGFYGTIDQHLILEDALAKFMDTEEAICYSDGASAVTSAIPAFAKKGDLLLIDEACSEPILTGANLSRATIRFFRHNDMEDLGAIMEAIAVEDRKLRRDTSQQRRFIVTEGVFRNTGDICLLREILALKEKFFYRLILDETLSFGTLGATGRGLVEHLQLQRADVEITVFTLDTVLASVGGVCVGTRQIVDHQRLSGAGYCFSASSAPFLSAAAIAALAKIQNEPELIQDLQHVAQSLHDGLKKVPFMKVVSCEATAVVHLVLEEARRIEDDAHLIQAIALECVHEGLGVVSSKFSIVRPYSDLRPSVMITANATWDDKKVAKIVKTITSAVKICVKDLRK